MTHHLYSTRRPVPGLAATEHLIEVGPLVAYGVSAPGALPEVWVVRRGSCPPRRLTLGELRSRSRSRWYRALAAVIRRSRLA